MTQRSLTLYVHPSEQQQSPCIFPAVLSQLISLILESVSVLELNLSLHLWLNSLVVPNSTAQWRAFSCFKSFKYVFLSAKFDLLFLDRDIYLSEVMLLIFIVHAEYELLRDPPGIYISFQIWALFLLLWYTENIHSLLFDQCH